MAAPISPIQSLYPVLKYNQTTPYIYNGKEYSVYFERPNDKLIEIAGKIYYEAVDILPDSSTNVSATSAGSYEATCKYTWYVYEGTPPSITIITRKENINYTATWTINKAAGKLIGPGDVTLCVNSTTSVEYDSTGELTWSYVSGLDDIEIDSSQISSIKTRLTIKSGSQSGVAYYLLTSAPTNNFEAETLALKITVNELPQSNFYVTPESVTLSHYYPGEYETSVDIYMDGIDNYDYERVTVSGDTYNLLNINYHAEHMTFWYEISLKGTATYSNTITLTFEDPGIPGELVGVSRNVVISILGQQSQTWTLSDSEISDVLIGKTYTSIVDGSMKGAISVNTLNNNKNGVTATFNSSTNELSMFINGKFNQFISNPDVKVSLTASGDDNFSSRTQDITLKPLKESYVNLYDSTSKKWNTYLIKVYDNNNWRSCDAKVHKKDGQIHKWLKLGVYDEES